MRGKYLVVEILGRTISRVRAEAVNDSKKGRITEISGREFSNHWSIYSGVM